MDSYKLLEYFTKHVEDAPDRECLVHGNRRLTYQQVQSDVDALATALHEMGVGAGTRIAIDLPNGPEWVILFLTAAKLGAVRVPLTSSLGYHELNYLLRHTEATVPP